MEAHLASTLRGGPQRLLADRPTAISAAVCAASVAICGLAVLILVRRVAGALDRPAPIVVLLGVALVIGCFSWLSRWLWRAAVLSMAGNSRAAVLDAVVGWAPSVSIVALTLGLSWPLDRFVDWLVWMPLWVADVLWRKSFFAGEPLADPSGNTADPWSPGFSLSPREDSFSLSPREDEIVLQQLTRTRNASGQESITGSLRADFVPGQRTAQVYVGFCPPFAGLPAIEVEQSDGPPARVTVGQVLPHGARIDIRPTRDLEGAVEVLFELFATCDQPRCRNC